MNENIMIDRGRWGARAVLTRPWSAELAKWFRENEIRELEVNEAKGWKGENVDFLADIPSLESLTLIDFSITNIEGIRSQTGLKYLDLNAYAKTPIDLSKFNLLEECTLEWNRCWTGLDTLFRLTTLFVNKFPGNDLKYFSSLRALRNFSLASPKIESLCGIDCFSVLTALGIYEAKKLNGLAGLEDIETLNILEINGCKHIREIGPIARLINIRRLSLCNDGEIESLRPISALSELEEFLFYESTNILDGDLSILTTLKKLRQVRYMDRKHYSHRRSFFGV